MKSLKYKLNINYIYIFFNNLNFTSGFWMIYLAAKGMSLTQLGLLEGIFHVTGLLMEIPTGAIADILGRKASRVIGRVMGLISIVLMITVNNFWVYALSFVLCALSYNLESGAGEALLYDTLLQHGQEDQYVKHIGRVEATCQVAQIITLSVAGFFAIMNYHIPFIASMIATFMALGVGLLLVEPMGKGRKEEPKTNIVQAIKKQYVDGFGALKGNGKLVYLTLLPSFMFVVNTISFFYIQNYWKLQGKLESTIGIYLAGAAVCGAIGGVLCHRIVGKVRPKQFMQMIPVIFATALVTLPFGFAGVVGFMCMAFLDAVFYTVVSDYINKEIESSVRATVISMQSAVFSLYMIILFPLFGALGDGVNMQTAFFALSGITALLVVINALYLRIGRHRMADSEHKDLNAS